MSFFIFNFLKTKIRKERKRIEELDYSSSSFNDTRDSTIDTRTVKRRTLEDARSRASLDEISAFPEETALPDGVKAVRGIGAFFTDLSPQNGSRPRLLQREVHFPPAEVRAPWEASARYLTHMPITCS